MNLTQAKKLVGIKREETLVTLESLEAAIHLCELDNQPEAKAIFTKRLARLWGKPPEPAVADDTPRPHRRKTASRQVKEAAQVVGLARPPVTTAELRDAIKACKRLLKHEHPDTGGSIEAARRIIQAMELFQNTIIPTCPECGARLARGAKYCRLHQRKKALPPVNCVNHTVEPAPKGNGNARIYFGAAGGPYAEQGFYLVPVQRVFKKWERTLGNDAAMKCFRTAAAGVLTMARNVGLAHLPRPQWQCAFELAAALASVVCDHSKAESWLLRKIHVLAVADQNGFCSWDEIAANFGNKFTPAQLRQSAKRLRLLTSKEMAAEFRKFPVRRW